MRRKKTLRILTVWVFAPIIFLLFYSTVFLAVACMVPSLTALLFDRRGGLRWAKLVAFGNSVGTTWLLIDFWHGEQSIEAALNILSNFETYLIAYSGAILTYCVPFVAGPMSSNWLRNRWQREYSQVVKERNALVKEWGESIRAAALPLLNNKPDPETVGIEGLPKDSAFVLDEKNTTHEVGELPDIDCGDSYSNNTQTDDPNNPTPSGEAFTRIVNTVPVRHRSQ